MAEWGNGRLGEIAGWRCGMAERQNGYDRMAER